MAEVSFPFGNADANEPEWQKMARLWLKTGVIDDRLAELAVTADGSGMTVTAAAGAAWVEGFYYENDQALALTIAAADATNPRIDTVVLRLSQTANSIVLAVVPGTAAASPTAPALTQTDAVYELPLANVTVPAAAGVIVAGNVTDRRTFTRPFDSAAYVAKALVDAKGDLLVGSAADAVARLAAGADGQVLRANAAAALGVEWAAASGGVTDAQHDVILPVTGETSTSTTYADLATAGPSVTATIGASGRVLVVVGCQLYTNTVDAYAYMSFAVTGATTRAASDNEALYFRTARAIDGRQASHVSIVTGLTPGSHTFTGKYRVTGGTGTWLNRRLIVIPA